MVYVKMIKEDRTIYHFVYRRLYIILVDESQKLN